MTCSTPRQLTLIDDVPTQPKRRRARSSGWRLDQATRARGLRGVDAARKALNEAAARHRAEESPHHTAA